ncbi:MAG: DUF2911 domain-containing protein [Bacteroidetes bacterium]|nr:DUF2911 domain-containing protein [Bacteroidota bacterium]
MIKVLCSTLLLLRVTLSVSAQSDSAQLPPMDKSPMDMSYYPSDYPILKISDKATDAPVVRVIYGRPQKNGRPVFGSLVEYGKVWRLGANEATEIEFYKDVTVAGKKIKKGRYTLYAIPERNAWTLIINKDTDTWGAFKYDTKNDVLRTSVPVITVKAPVETLSITFTKTNPGCNLLIAWDSTEVLLPVVFK